MNWIEILLIILGVVAFIGSFLIKGKVEVTNEPVQVDPNIIKDMVNKEMEDARERVNEVVDETLQYAVEKTERASERISNEKIMAINEYSDTVLADINKSHQEVMFLYDMLNDKHANIKETVKQVDKTTKEAKEIISKEISLEAAQTPKSEEKFETFNFVDQLPHIKKTDIAVVQPQVEVPVVAEQPVPVQTPLEAQPPVEEPEPVAVSAVVQENIIEPVAEPVIMTEAVESSKNENEVQTDTPENNNDRILEMHKAGIDNVEIAKELGLGVGEVKLVINLFKGAI